jgi:hypothetical protein
MAGETTAVASRVAATAVASPVVVREDEQFPLRH